MKPEWNQPDAEDEMQLRRLKMRAMREQERLLPLLDDRRRTIGLDLNTLDTQSMEARKARESAKDNRIRDGISMAETLACAHSDQLLARERSSLSQREYAVFLEAQMRDRRDREKNNQIDSVSVPTGVDPNQLAEQHRREIAHIQAQLLIEQMGETFSDISTALSSSEPSARDRTYMDHRDRVVNGRRRIQISINEENARRCRGKSNSTKSPDNTTLPETRFHSIRTDFKGLPRVHLEAAHKDNSILVEAKEREYVEELARAETNTPGLPLPSVVVDPAIIRRVRETECARSNRNRQVGQWQPDRTPDSFNDRFGNSLF
jgi:hypothetical protein